MSHIGMLYPSVLRRQYGLEMFVETGCFLGKSLEQARRAGFERLVSCDICERYVRKCRKHFPQAQIVHASSTAMLEGLLPTLKGGGVLFWLDAHFPATFGLADEVAWRYPLPRELGLIRQAREGWERDVIAVDDLRVIRDPRNPRWRPGELRGQHAGCYQDISLHSLCAPFEATHDVALFEEAEGMLLFVPRTG